MNIPGPAPQPHPADRYHAGDAVRIMRASLRPELVGTRALVLAGQRYHRIPGKGADEYQYAYMLNTPAGNLCAPEECLAPWTDCYDKTTWATCDWQPPHLRKLQLSNTLPAKLQRLQTASERLRAAAAALRKQLKGPGGADS